MASKRTCKPHYGKTHQRMERQVHKLTVTGNENIATSITDAVQASLRIKAMRHLQQMAHRPIAKFMKMDRKVLAMLRKYYGNA